MGLAVKYNMSYVSPRATTGKVYSGSQIKVPVLVP